jgi:catalase
MVAESTPIAPDTEAVEKLSKDLLDVVENIFGHHAGFRPLHAKGIMCKGEFKPSSPAKNLTCAPHVADLPSTPVVVRFSNSTGIPIIPDTDPNAGPRGFAIRFQLGEHLHTDIVAHSAQTFPTRTGEEFLEFLKALNASGPDTPSPKPIEKFLNTHPAAAHYVHSPKPVPLSFASEIYFGVTALKFLSAEGKARYGRFQVHPVGGNYYLSPEALLKRACQVPNSGANCWG